MQHSVCLGSQTAELFVCVRVLSQEQQQLLSAYQSLVVKQLVSQSQSRKQEEEAEGEEQDEEAASVRTQLLALTPQVKDLLLSQRKTSVSED